MPVLQPGDPDLLRSIRARQQDPAHMERLQRLLEEEALTLDLLARNDGPHDPPRHGRRRAPRP